MTQKNEISKPSGDVYFEFEKLKFEIDYFHQKLISRISMIGGFQGVMNSIEEKIPEWRDRASKIDKLIQ